MAEPRSAGANKALVYAGSGYFYWDYLTEIKDSNGHSLFVDKKRNVYYEDWTEFSSSGFTYTSQKLANHPISRKIYDLLEQRGVKDPENYWLEVYFIGELDTETEEFNLLYWQLKFEIGLYDKYTFRDEFSRSEALSLIDVDAVVEESISALNYFPYYPS